MKKLAIAAALVFGTASFAVAQEARIPADQFGSQQVQTRPQLKIYEGRNAAIRATRPTVYAPVTNPGENPANGDRISPVN